MAEDNGGRIAAVFAADSKVDVGSGLATEIGSDLNKFANALSTEDKLLVLATLMVRMSEKEP